MGRGCSLGKAVGKVDITDSSDTTFGDASWPIAKKIRLGAPWWNGAWGLCRSHPWTASKRKGEDIPGSQAGPRTMLQCIAKKKLSTDDFRKVVLELVSA